MPALLIIIKSDSPGPDVPTRYLRGELIKVYETDQPLGGVADTDIFYRFTVTDRTVQEMNQYLSRYNKDFEFTLINANGNQRRYEVKNNNANTLGDGFWTEEGAQQIKEQWEVDHPNANITTIGFPNDGPNGLGNIWDMSGVFEAGEGQDFIDTVTGVGRTLDDRRNVWYLSPAFMDNLAANGGVQSGTSSQLDPNLKDRRLD